MTATLDIPLGPQLTSEQASEIFKQGEEAVVFALLEMSKKHDINITRLLLYKNDGTVSYSNDQNEVGRRIDSVVVGISVDEKGVHAGESGEKGSFAMLRPLFNQEGCKKCHTGDSRLIGGVYISIGGEELKRIRAN